MITRKSANCSRKIRRTLLLPPSCSSLGPYCSRRLAASCAGQALFGAVQIPEQLHPALLPDVLFCLHKSPSFPAGRKKARLLRQCLRIDTKVSPFQPRSGAEARTDAVGYTIACASYSLLVLEALYPIFPRMSSAIILIFSRSSHFLSADTNSHPDCHNRRVDHQIVKYGHAVAGKGGVHHKAAAAQGQGRHDEAPEGIAGPCPCASIE